MTPEEFEEAVGEPLAHYRCDCHRASIALVQSGVLGEARVARGSTPGVFGQHSWVVLGMDCYKQNAQVIDPTLWSYDPKVKGIWEGRAFTRPHTPHGAGSIWEWGKPEHCGGETIELAGCDDLPADAQAFLELLGPLDRKGWGYLAHAPVGGWPAKEIIAAMYKTDEISPLIPIDIVGMITDLNPAGLYLAGLDKEVTS